MSKLNLLLQKQKRLQEQIKLLEQKQKTDERKRETRRKILTGALVWQAVNNNELSEENILNLLDRHLDKPRDRDLFNLGRHSNNQDER